MYLIINDNRHSCTRRIVGLQSVIYTGVDSEPEEISGMIQMYRDDGFLMSDDDSSKFVRKLYANSTLTLTNEPEPEIIPVDPENSEEDPNPEEFSSVDEILNVLLGVNE